MTRQAYPELQLSLQWANPRHRDVLSRYKVQRAVKRALRLGITGLPDGMVVQAAQITVRIVDNEEAQTLNHQYRAKNYATNVLTFNYSVQPVLCADLVLCGPVLEQEALEQRKDLEAHYAHMLVHGTLHALGFDHEHSQQAAEHMEDLEVQILQGIGYKHPYKP